MLKPADQFRAATPAQVQFADRHSAGNLKFSGLGFKDWLFYRTEAGKVKSHLDSAMAKEVKYSPGKESKVDRLRHVDEEHPLVQSIKDKYMDTCWETCTHVAGTLLNDGLQGHALRTAANSQMPAILKHSASAAMMKALSAFLVESAQSGSPEGVTGLLNLMEKREGVKSLIDFLSRYRAEANDSPYEQPTSHWLKWLAQSRGTMEQIKETRWPAMVSMMETLYKSHAHYLPDDRHDLLKLKALMMFSSLPLDDAKWTALQQQLDRNLKTASRHTSLEFFTNALFTAFFGNQAAFSEKWLDNFENLLHEQQDNRLPVLKLFRAGKKTSQWTPERTAGIGQLYELMLTRTRTPMIALKTFTDLLGEMSIPEAEWQTVLANYKHNLQTGTRLDAETLFNTGLKYKDRIPLSWFESVQQLAEQQKIPGLAKEYLKLAFEAPESALPENRRAKVGTLLEALSKTGSLSGNGITSFQRLADLPVVDDKWNAITDYLALKLERKEKVKLGDFVAIAYYGQTVPIGKGTDLIASLKEVRDFKLEESSDKQIAFLLLKLYFTDPNYPNIGVAPEQPPIGPMRRAMLLDIVNEAIKQGTVSNTPVEAVRQFKLLAQLPAPEEQWTAFAAAILEAIQTKKPLNFEEFFAIALYGRNPESLPEGIRKHAEPYINFNWSKSPNKQISYHFLKGRFMDPAYPISEMRRDMLLKTLDDAIANGYSPKTPNVTINCFELFARLPVSDENWKGFAKHLHETIKAKQTYGFDEYLATTLFGKEPEDLPEDIRKLAEPYLKYDWSKSDDKQIVYRHLKQHFANPDLPLAPERRTALREILDLAIEKKSQPANANASIEKFKMLSELPVPEQQWQSLAAALKAGISSGQSFDLDQYMSVALMDIDPATLPEKLQKLAKNNTWMNSGDAKQIPYVYLKQYFSNPELPLSDERRTGLQKVLYEAIENKYKVGNVQETLSEFKLLAELPVSEPKWEALKDALIAQIQGKSSFKLADYLSCGLADEDLSTWPEKWQGLAKKYDWKKSQSEQVQYIYLKQYFANPSLPLSDKRRTLMQKLLSGAIQFQYKKGEKEEIWKLFSRMPASDTLWASLVNNVLEEHLPKKKAFSIKSLCNYVYWENPQKIPKDWLNEYHGLVSFDERKDAWKKMQLSKAYATANTPDEISMLDQILSSGSGGLVDFFPESEIPLGLGATYVRVMQGDELAFVKMMPHFLTEEYTPTHFSKYMSRLESSMDSYRANQGRGRGHHPNEAELMLLFRNPGVLKGQDKTISNMTAAITSIDRWIEYQIQEVNDSLIRLWGNIGFLAHSFLFWRFDTQGGPGSLFGQFGFQPIAKRETDKVFGPGYLISKTIKPDLPIDDKTLIEFRRGYMLASNPQWGTLIIRNSSPVFGRDLLKHSAYYTKQAFSPEELKNLNPANDSRLLPILRPQIYLDSGGTRRVQQLTEELNHMKKAYAKWKLDITADGFQDGAFRGYQNGGFAKIVAFLEKRMAEQALGINKQPLPELAFVNPNYPAYWSYAFTDANGQQAERYRITPERLEELKDLLANQWNTQKYPNSDWVRFLQTGIDHGAELILMAPETN